MTSSEPEKESDTAADSGNTAALAESNSYCDICEEEWDKQFFCKICSGLQHFPGEIELIPNIMWGGKPGDEYTWQDRESEYKKVCGNCCTCHTKKTNTQSNIT